MDSSLIDQIEKEHKIHKLSSDEHMKWLYDLYFQTQEKIARVRSDIHRQKVEDERRDPNDIPYWPTTFTKKIIQLSSNKF